MADFLRPPAAHFWDKRWTFECRCGSKDCLGLIDRYIARPAADPNSAIVQVGITRNKGRGVFAKRTIRQGEVIERAPVLVIPARDWAAMEKTVAYDYTFGWGANGEDAALALGYGSLYNHSFAPNTRFERNFEGLVIEFIAIRNIACGEEIVVNYNEDPDDGTPLWFPAE
jgi:SET domain-containing protein